MAASPVWLITGATSGLGRALAQEALEAGERVAVTGRDGARARALAEEWGPSALGLALDVADPASVEAAVAEAERWSGGIDRLVNCAGGGLLGAVEETDDAEVAGLFETNFFGAVRTIRAALPGMRARGRGHIVNVGSIAGRSGVPGSGLYAASKAALKAMSEALAAEIRPFGLRVTVVEPGAFRTDIAGRSRVEMRRRLPEYEATAGRRRETVRALDGRQTGDPRRAAAAIRTVVAAAEPPLGLILGPDAFARAVATAEAALAELREWRELSLSTDYPD